MLRTGWYLHQCIYFAVWSLLALNDLKNAILVQVSRGLQKNWLYNDFWRGKTTSGCNALIAKTASRSQKNQLSFVIMALFLTQKQKYFCGYSNAEIKGFLHRRTVIEVGTLVNERCQLRMIFAELCFPLGAVLCFKVTGAR
jgi:hypothetical protein